jgi:hypothetical protein
VVPEPAQPESASQRQEADQLEPPPDAILQKEERARRRRGRGNLAEIVIEFVVDFFVR